MLGPDRERYSAARRELRGDDHFAWSAGLHEIVENVVCDSFIECALVTIGGEIEFQ